MGSADNRTGPGNIGGVQTGNVARLATLLMTVMALGLIAALVSGSQTAVAYVGARDGHERPGPPAEADAAEVYVWAAGLTVGESSDASGTYLGYVPDAVDEEGRGNLQGDTFTYRDVDYTVLALFHQRMTDGSRQLVLRADRRLPERLILYTKDGGFSLPAAIVTGDEPSTYTWTVDEDTAWVKGQRTYVALLEPMGGHIPASAMAPETSFGPLHGGD